MLRIAFASLLLLSHLVCPGTQYAQTQALAKKSLITLAGLVQPSTLSNASLRICALVGRNNRQEFGQPVTISTLLAQPTEYHMKVVAVRGRVTRPELHVDETTLFINFVFELKDGADTLVVFGQHDRTQGDIQIETDRTVEVVGIFWKERVAHDHRLENNVEALHVTFFPPLTPDRT